MDLRHPLVSWTEACALGLPAVDAQHRHLFARVDAWSACVLSGAPAGHQRAVLQALHQDLLAHCAEEETFMQLMDYPLLPEHRQQHQALARQLAGPHAGPYAGPCADTAQGRALQQVQDFRHALLQHVQVADRSYAAHQQLERLADARPWSQAGQVLARQRLR